MGLPALLTRVQSVSTSLDAQLLPIGLACSDSGGGLQGCGQGWVCGLGRPPWSLASWHRREAGAGWSPPGPLLPSPGGEGRVEAQTECPLTDPSKGSAPSALLGWQQLCGQQGWPAGVGSTHGPQLPRLQRGWGRASRALTAPSRPTRAWVGSGTLPSQVPRWSGRPRRKPSPATCGGRAAQGGVRL